MTVTRDQAQMITTLAIAARPHRAPTWDPPGVMAQLAKVAGLDLAEVAIAALRLARDPNAQTPADIANPTAECWREQLKPPRWTPEVLKPAIRCRVCGRSRTDCARNPHGDHDFAPDIREPRNYDIAPVIAELKGLARPTEAPDGENEGAA
jgi:hypothetical protein